MTTGSIFPNFKPLTIEDHETIRKAFWDYQPETSELTFINLFIWREYYNFQWSIHEDWLLILAEHDGQHFALPPVGPGPRVDVSRKLLQGIRDTYNEPDPTIERADLRLAEELKPHAEFSVEETREHFDYIYSSENLGTLAGRKYSKKRNHINQFMRAYGENYRYATLSEDLVPQCLALAEVWCEQRQCTEDISLNHEFRGIRDALKNLTTLKIEGGLILVDEKVQAFALGERLNANTAVVHIEKGNPDFKGIYPMMTKSFSEQHWMGQVDYINREQDLDEPGLRRAKESYYPTHLMEKFRIRLS